MLESNLVKKFLKQIRAAGGWAEKVHGGPYQRRGLLDICGHYRGRFFAIEVKVWPAQPTPIQQQVMKEINDSGGIAIVAWTADEITALLTRIANE